MCGICGIYSPKLANRVETVAKMNQALLHRGPNDGGQYDGQVASIAMRRLTIIDLATGHQPIANEDNSLQIVFNGEIYNYRELREQLLATGRHTFKTSSDTEVILHLYEEYGEDTPKYLQGMFAFCIYDTKKDTLYLARDRFGEKPLFYSITGENSFAFSSEVTSLLEFAQVERKLDTESLLYFLNIGYCPTPLTAFKEIRELSPGHWMRWGQGKLAIGKYYQPNFTPNPDLRREEDAVEAVRTTLLKAVKRQMVSDVPLGAFLSGGIDSSAVVAAMQHQSGQRIKTFTVKFDYAPFDESPIARAVADHLGTDHHEFLVTNGGFQDEDLWRIVRHVGQPFLDSSAIPTYILSQKVRDHVTVSLSGDGGDEMFAGYRIFQACLGVDQIAKYIPRLLLSTTGSVLQRVASVPSAAQNQLLGKLARVTRAACLSKRDRSWKMSPLFAENVLDELVAPWVSQQWQGLQSDAAHALLGEQDGMSRLRQIMDCWLRYFLASDMLVKVDRMSMATSLEVRAPMLDVELAELAMSLPDEFLLRDGTTKYILRKAIRPWLPETVFTHPKWGFTIPLHLFQNNNFSNLCHELLLSPQNEAMQSLFSRASLERVVKRGLERKFESGDLSDFLASQQLWALLTLAGWMQHFKVTL
ncbi:MAG TPA: asparagine synthase (glutamine-hydrolyzing) [Blastocatellia bacterium]|nr:asparagine synthase (glutamine-hydrolyzing) [Blastocatellia bacterium]